MKKHLFCVVLMLLAYGCQNSSKKLVSILIDVDRETFNPLLEPDVNGNISIVGIYSNGTNKLLSDAEIILSGKTIVASGDVEVIKLEGNKLIPGEGGIATIEALVIKDGQTFKSAKDIVVRPFYRDYHQTLVLKLFMGMDGERIEKREHDIVFNREGDPGRICTFEEALEVVKKTDNLTRGIPKIIYLVGWQKGGHDHLYPAWNEANPKLKRDEDATAVESLRWLIREARQYNTTISLHINMVDCFKDDPLWDEYVKRDIIARDENGDILLTWENVKDHKMSHLSYTREWAEGMAQKRIDGLIEMLPELKDGHTIHIDVFIAKWAPEDRPLSPWHAKPENGGIDMYKEVETQRKIFKYWREKGFDVTGEGILWAHPPDEGFYGLQPMAWWYPDDKKLQMRIPEKLTARGRTGRTDQGDYRFTSSMQGETIYLKDKENLPGFLDMFCKTTLPWFYLSQHDRVSFIDEVLYYSDGIKAGEEDGKRVIRQGNYVLREDNNLFVEVKWKDKEIIAYSEDGYDNKTWIMPETWKDVKSVDLYKITLKGCELLEPEIAVVDNHLTLSLDKNTGVSIIPSGSHIDNNSKMLDGNEAFINQIPSKSYSIDPFAWGNISMAAKPGVFWWWLGSSVNEAEIERQLIMLRNAGFGGVLVCPIYETKEPVIAPIPYLSERWIEVFRFTLVKAKQLGMFVDVTFGGGWPAGGPWIRKENGERVFRQEELRLDVTPNKPFDLMNEEGKDPIVCVNVLANNKKTFVSYNNDQPASIVEPVIKNGKTVWKLPAVGSCRVVVTRMGYEDWDVYVAHKGGKGRVMDYWSTAAFWNMVEPLDTMVSKLGDLRPRAYFVDSFEGRGGTTPGIFEAFEKLNGYDLRPYLHNLTNSKATGTPENIRLWHDYRQTMAALHVQFVERFTKWATERGSTTRYQYPGDPANPLNTGGAAGIPEDYPPINTSAAHIFGKKLTSREAFTWGAGHNFKDYMDFYRKWADADLMEGLNHIFYHGTPVTPLAEPWPGPMYYAGGNFSEKMPFFNHISAMNDYFSRLQSTLQESEPETDVLMLWSVQDFWNKPPFKFVWRNSDDISSDDDLQRKLRRKLVGRGIQTDLSSEEILMEKAEIVDGNIKCGEAVYKALVIAETGMVSNGTLKKIEQLVRDGGLIIFMEHIPVEAPEGLPLVQNLSESIKALEKMTKEIKGNTTRLHIASNLEDLLDIMKRNGISEDGLLGNIKGRPAHYSDSERWAGFTYSNVLGKVSTYRVNLDDRTTYLLRNNTEKRMDVWVPLIHLDEGSSKVVIGIPRTGEIFLGEHRRNDSGGKKVHLVLEPTELVTVTTVPDQEKTDGINPMSYGQKTTLKNIGDRWHISWADYEGNKHQFTTDTLRSWTDYPQLGLFSGIVHYETSFKLNKRDLKNRVLLDVGLIHESAEVVVNGVRTGFVWTTPFEIDISGYLKEGTNTLVLKVANKAQNRIIDMHRKKIHWQKSKLEEVNDARTSSHLLKVESLKPMPSGLIGPLRLLRTDQGDYRFTSSMQGEMIYLKDKENLPGFLEMFCKTTLPWFYLSQYDRVSLINEVLYYSDGIKACEENGKKVIRRGNYVLREDNNLFVEAKWKDKEIFAYSEDGYDKKTWIMPDPCKDVKSVDLYKITLKGCEILEPETAVVYNHLTLSLDKNTGYPLYHPGAI